MKTLQEMAEQIDKMITYARDERRNHAYIKGLRDAKKVILEELEEYDGDTLPES